ncbi:MAG TPA: ParM/StbA family protein [Desulfobacteraceae bacterium]|nr:ParM/StbA family protein [Desulfobacteraceae bacterium]
MEIIGIDVGFGFTKAYNGSNSVIFKSITGDAPEIQFNPGIGQDNSVSNLHVTIDDKSYFLGNFAEAQSRTWDFTLEQDKLVSDFVKILAITAAGVCSEGSRPIKVVSGLPVGFYKRDKKRFKQAITGEHEVTFHNQNGKDVTKKININAVQMIPQPIGSIFNHIMDDNGRISNRELSMQKIGVIDIGFRTTDFSVFDHLKYIERSSTTMDTGISKCFSVIANKLREESKVNVELFRMYHFIEQGMVKIRGKEYNIANLKKRVFTHAASAIASDVNRLWQDDWDIDSIFLSGGGSMELAQYLQAEIQGNVIPVSTSSDARLNNVYGYLKFGRYKWGHSEPPKPSSPPEDASDPGSSGNPTEKAQTQSQDDTHTPKNGKGRSWLKRQS